MHAPPHTIRFARSKTGRAALFGPGVLCLLPDPAWAHAVVQRYALPVPLWYYLIGAGLVVALTFVVLMAFRKEGTPAPP